MMLFVSCTDNFHELNTDPTLISEDQLEVGMLFTNVQKNSIFHQFSYNHQTQQIGYLEHQGNSVLPERQTTLLMSWARNYIRPLNDIIRLGSRDPLRANQVAIARIYRVWIFHQLTDGYGDIPYSQMGLSQEEAINYPEYERQEDIYRDMLDELDEAVADLSDDPDLLNYGRADLLYGGDVNMWRRFGNSLRFRLAMRVRFADAQLASEHINAVINEPLISEREHIASVITEGEDADIIGNRNPMYNHDVTNEIPAYANHTTSELLQVRNDPRLSIYYDPAPEPHEGDLWRGRPVNIDVGFEEEYDGQWTGFYAQERNARLGEHFIQAEYEIKILHAPEVYFLRAEAAMEGITNESAEAMHREGIRQAMELYDVDPGDINAYLDSDAGRLDGSYEENLEEIIVQKYLSNFMLYTESWAEHRRTGYPTVWAGQRGDITNPNHRTPWRRYTYPTDEYLKNRSNVEAAVNRLSGGDHNWASRVWWDQRPGLPLFHPRHLQFPPHVHMEFDPMNEPGEIDED